VPRNHPPSPSQLRLSFEADRDQPPKAPPSAALLEALAELLLEALAELLLEALAELLLEALAELLLAALGTMTATTGSGEANNERQDRR
jgi:hypothetical protein